MVHKPTPRPLGRRIVHLTGHKRLVAVCLTILLASGGCEESPRGRQASEPATEPNADYATNDDVTGQDAGATDASPALDDAASPPAGQRIALPTDRKIYHAVLPGSISGAEDDFTPAMLDAYEEAAGKRAAWVYFSNNWFTPQERVFPTDMAGWIRDRQALPVIRLMLRSSMARPENPIYSLQRIIDGDFDADLASWGRSARDFGTALIVEYGTEVNGDWFLWNAAHNGAGTTDGFGDPDVADGRERFVAAYRHIIDVIRRQGATNISWLFHIQCGDWPENDWNRFEGYYPGDSYIDWLGFSQYGSLSPSSSVQPFRSRVDECYPRLLEMAPTKPIAAIEIGTTAGHPQLSASDFAREALGDILNYRWPEIRAFGWWNERWENGDNPETNMQIQDDAELSRAFNETLTTYAERLQLTPLYQ